MKHLIGDGIRDDTEALQALADWEIVLAPDGRELQRTPAVFSLPPGRYRITRPIRLP